MKINNLYQTIIFLILFTLSTFIVLRIFKLNTLPVFVDEAIYIRWSQVMKNESTLRFLPQSDGKQPLFMWITISFFKLTKDPVIAARLVSVATSFASLVGIGVLSYFLVGNIVTACLTSLLFALTPFNVFFDRMALVDSMLSTFGIWTLVFSVWYCKSQRLDVAMFLGFAIGGGLLTKSPAIFFYLWLAISIVLFLKPKKISLVEISKIVGSLLLAIIISQAMFNILRLGPNFQLINSRNLDYVFPLSEAIRHPLNPLLSNLGKSVNWLWFLYTPPVAILILAGLFFFRPSKPIIYVFLISLSVLLAQGFVAKVYTSRYILFAVNPLLVIAGAALSNLWKRYKYLSLVFLVWPLLVSYGYAYQPIQSIVPKDMRHGYLEEWTAGWGQKEVGDYLVNLGKRGQKIVVGTEGFFGTLPDGLQIYTQNYPNIIVIGVGQPLSGIPDSLKNTSKDNLIFLVVNKSRNLIPSHDLSQFTLIKEFPKPNRHDGSQEVLQFFQYH